MDFISDVLEEIALEGLDGITIETLWVRLSNRPNFRYGPQVISDDTDTKVFIWNVVQRLREVKFFRLETPRKSLNMNHCLTASPESDIIIETCRTSEDLYPHCMIDDNGIMGSCSTYNSREDISIVVRKLDLQRAVSMYGNQLIIVASQDVRKMALIELHFNPNLEISPMQFCILERVGRSRYRGEPTQGKLGLAAIGEDSKTIFYLRKYLLKHNLLMKQYYRDKSPINTSGLLLHLPRFYCLHKPKYIKSIEKVFDIIMEQPNNTIDYNVLREQLSMSLKKLKNIDEFQKYFNADNWLPFRVLYPKTDPKNWTNKSNEDKKLRVVQLRDPDANIQDLYKRFLGIYEEEDDDEEEKYEGLLDETKRCFDVPLLNQCFALLKNSKDGLSQSEVAKALGLQKIQARTILKNLTRTGAVCMFMVDIGRQRISKYCLKDSIDTNEHFFFEDNGIMIQSFLKPKGDNNDSVEKSDETVPISIKEENSCLDLDITNTSLYSYNTKDTNVNVIDKNDNRLEHVQNVPSISGKRNISMTDSDIESEINIKKHKAVSDGEKENGLIQCSSNVMKIDHPKRNTSPIREKLRNNVIRDHRKMNIRDKIKSSTGLLDSNKQTSETLDSTITHTADKSENPSPDKIPVSVSISDDYRWLLPNTCKNELKKIQGKSLKTLRLLKRSNLVIEAVHRLKVISDVRKLMAMISESEYREGLPSRMDKKSLMRILFKLAHDKHIKVYRAVLKHNFKTLYLNFICDMSVNSDDPIIKSAIEFSKLKLQAARSIPPSSNRSKPPSITFEKRVSPAHYPKFNRMKIVHKFLFTLVYDYIGDEDLDQDIAKSRVQRECQLSDEEWRTLPKLYLSRIDERMFVPPLPKYNEQGQGRGWSVLSDVIIRMPLSVFLRVVQVPYSIPELEEYMNSPIKKYYLVNDLPSNIRNCIFGTRKYVFTIFDVMTKLVYIGLLQLGAHHYKEKDHMFTYLNRRTMLIDTTSSKPGYNKISANIDYPVQNYLFTMTEDVNQYWHNCWKICMNTRLGGRSFALGTEVILESVHEKEDMINAMTAREFLEAPQFDNGIVPGDKLGAAGFDSALYSHLKRNWVFKNQLAYDNGKMSQARRLRNLLSSAINGKSKAADNSANNVQMKPTGSKVALGKDKCAFVIPVNRSSRMKNVKVLRINPVKKSLHRKPFYDQVDKEALKRMIKLRVDWSAEEDRLLLICKVASLFICPDTRKQINANMFLAFREVLHRTLQTSKNKTSRACQRRVVYMMRTPSTFHSVNLCVEELKRDKYIMETYGNTMELIAEELKKTGKKMTDMGNIWRDRFKRLVEELMDRFKKSSFNNFSFGCMISTTNSRDCFVLPDSLAEFNKLYSVQVVEKIQKSKDMYMPITSVGDIYSAVINSTIHSTLSCNSDKTSWSYHLFSIYQQYPERILRSTLNQLREKQMVSFKKSYQVYGRSGNNYYLPLSASPYQLSITYVNLIQTRYQSSLYTDCYETYSELLKNSNAKKSKSPCKGYELLSLTGGSAAVTVELYSSNIVKFDIELPNQVIVLDPNIQDKDETYARLVKRYKDILTNYRKDLTTSVLFQKHNYMSIDGTNDDNDDDYTEDEVGSKIDLANDEIDNTHAIQNVAKAASRIALYLMNDDSGNQSGLVPKEMDHVYDFFVVNSCRVFIKTVKPLSPTNQTCDHGIVSDDTVKNVLQWVRDTAIFHNIEPTNRLELAKDKEEFTNTPNEDDDDENGYIIKTYDDVTINKIISNNFESGSIDKVGQMLSQIKGKKEFGLTNSEVVEEFGNNWSTLNIINKLIDLSFILKTGVVHCRYVYHTFARPWLLHSYRNLRLVKDSRTPLDKLEYFKVTEKKSSDEICSDDDSPDSKRMKLIIDAERPSTSEDAAIINANIINDLGMCEMDDKIDDTRWVMTKENLDKLTNHKMSEPIRVMMKPWIRVDGTLNRRVLDMMLSSILSHVMLCPGASLLSIQNRFSPGYQPMHVRELCDILIKLNCLFRYSVTLESKRTLFSKPCQVVVGKSTGLESEDEIRYEADRFAIINLGKLLETRPYTKDFINCLLGK